jgi:hypothetical protein
MNENENKFENVRRLLKLKRHEVPPPGYFNNFSDQVISRIRAGEAGNAGSLTERLNVQAPWLVNLLHLFEAKPGVIGAFATSLCLLLVVGVMVAERSDAPPEDLMAFLKSAPLAGNPLLSGVTPEVAQAESGGITVSTNPVISLQPVTTFFGQQNQNPLLVQQASFAR